MCRYAELLALAKARHVIVPPAYRIDEDEALVRTVAAGAFNTRADLVGISRGRESRSGSVLVARAGLNHFCESCYRAAAELHSRCRPLVGCCFDCGQHELSTV